VQTVPHGVGVAEDLRRRVIGGAVRVQPRPEGIERSSAGSAFNRPSTEDLIFAMTSGALTAAIASGVSSNTATSEPGEGFPVSASRANRGASLVSDSS
jgi:hypothetical protein